MVDELFTPPPTKKRKQSQVELSPPPRSRQPTKKARTKEAGAASGKVKASKPKNATPGPSRLPATVKSHKTTQARPLLLDSTSESEFGSDRDPPLGIIRKPKVKKVPEVYEQKTSRKGIVAKRKAGKETVVHIGAIELTDDSDDEPLQRVNLKIDTSIIDLCSSDNDDGPETRKVIQKEPSKKPDISDDESLIVLSSEKEDQTTSKLPTSKNTIRRKTNFSYKKKFAPETISAASESHSLGSQKCIKTPVPSTRPPLDRSRGPSSISEANQAPLTNINPLDRESSPIRSDDSPKLICTKSPRRAMKTRPKSESSAGLSVEEIQLTFTKAAEKWNQKPLSLRLRPFLSKLGSPKYESDPRNIDFSSNTDPVDLLTPLFFERATLDVTSKLRVARKRAQKLKQVLPTPSLAVHDVSTASKIRQEVINSRRFVDILRTKKEPSANLVGENMPLTSLSLADDCQAAAIDDEPAAVKSPCSSLHEPILDDHTVDAAQNSTTESSSVSISLNTTPPSSSVRSGLPTTQTLLDAEVSDFTLPSLLESYNNDDSDSDISLSCLDFAYPDE